jgi:hypothetical protein
MRKPDATMPDLLEQMGYETRDIDLRRIFFWIAMLFVLIFGAMVISIVFYIIFIPGWAKLGQPTPIPANRRLPPHPQVQVDPKKDMRLYQLAEDRVLRAEIGDAKSAKPALSVDQAVDLMASERGIAGVRGTAVRQRGTSYPGSGDYEGASSAAAPAESTNGGER